MNQAEIFSEITPHYYNDENGDDDGYVIGFFVSATFSVIGGAIVALMSSADCSFWLYGLKCLFVPIITFAISVILFYLFERKEFRNFIVNLFLGTVIGYIISYAAFFWIKRGAIFLYSLF